MEKQYLFMLVLNDVSRFKHVKKKLIELNYERFTVIDTFGSTAPLVGMEFTSMLSGTISESENKQYNKTLFLVMETEDEVVKLMDELSKVIHIDKSKPGKGIMFTIPIIKSQGVRF